jgi:ubiquinone/menaquinone biosynthesis C-methylase UbiE
MSRRPVSHESRASTVGLTLPPAEYMRLVCGDKPNLREHFESVGRQIARALSDHGMLGPGARLLDIGCGCGRVARHLLDSPVGAYAGFDRHPGMIEWARSNIGGRDDRFQFQLVDVQSGYEELDNNVGTVSPEQFVFPYDDGEFTGALAASVFTHIDLPATSRYLSETARVLAPGGRVAASFFLDETTGSMGRTSWNFVIREDDLRRAVEQAALEVLEFASAEPPSRQSWLLLEKRRNRADQRPLAALRTLPG